MPERSYFETTGRRARPTPLNFTTLSSRREEMATPPNHPLANPKLVALSKGFTQLDLDGHNLPPTPAPSSPRSGRNYAIATQLVYSEGNDQYNAASVPIYQVWLHRIQ